MVLIAVDALSVFSPAGQITRDHPPQCTHTTSLQNQRSVRQWLSNPARCKCTENMAMRNEEDIALCGIRVLEARAVVLLPDLSDQRIEATDNIIR